MKAKLTFFVFLIVAFNSCKKDEVQPLYPKYIFFGQANTYIYDKVFKTADNNRSQALPMGYEDLTDSLYTGFVEVWNENILNELDAFTKTVNKTFREGTDRWSIRQAYNKVKAGFHPNFYSFSPDFCEGLHEMIEDYVLGVIDGNPEWSEGAANEGHRQAVVDFLDKVDPDNSWEMTYGQIIRAGIKDYVVEGDMPKNKRNGWLFFHAEKPPK